LTQRAAQTWPGVDVTPADFSRYLDERLEVGDAASSRHLSDLYLACACSRGDRRALALFERHLMAQVPAHIAAIDASAAFADEVMQRLRKKLFVREGEHGPRIGDYRGRGPLGGWLRVAAIRVARDLKRTEKAKLSVDEERGLPLRSALPDP